MQDITRCTLSGERTLGCDIYLAEPCLACGAELVDLDGIVVVNEKHSEIAGGGDNLLGVIYNRICVV